MAYAPALGIWATVRAELAAGSMIEIPCEFAQMPSAGAYAIALYENEKKKTFLDFLSHFHF